MDDTSNSVVSKNIQVEVVSSRDGDKKIRKILIRNLLKTMSFRIFNSRQLEQSQILQGRELHQIISCDRITCER